MDDILSYEKITSIEQAVKECIRIAMFDESEPMLQMRAYGTVSMNELMRSNTNY